MSEFWDQYARARVSRRRAIRSGAVAVIAAGGVALVGCDLRGGGSSHNDEDAGTPRQGGTLRFGTTVPASYGLDPHLEQGGDLPIIARLYGYPFHVDPRDDSLILDHAASVEQPASDVYVVRMGDHAYHDGAPAFGRRVRSHDMVHSMWRYRDHPLVVNHWWHANMLEGSGGSEERTVVIKTRRPYVYSLAEMGDINGGAILPQETIEQALDLRAGGAGSGPMQLGLTAGSGRVQLVRFDGHKPEMAWVDAMEWQTFSNDEEMLAAFDERRLDVVALSSSRAASEARSIGGATLLEQPSLSWLSLGFRVDRAPFADARVRRAIDIGLDRASIVDAAGGASDLTGPVSARLADGYWSLTLEEIAAAQLADRPADERRAEAQMLISAAGAAGASCVLRTADSPERRDLAEIIAQQLEGIGLTATVEALDQTSWYFAYRRGNFDAILISHPPFETPDASLRLYHSSGGGAETNPFGFGDPGIDRLIERSWREASREERRETILEAQRLMIEARALIHLFAPNEYAAAHGYVGDSGIDLPGSLARYHFRQWLGAGEGRRDD
jgi:peptide/nickel transport system substrate-binding protein